ncbi:MAG: HAMP domain-containing sensor histidine kinase [Candidatus Marinimicrobia bacterium]|nr:HAMP domain-containing sensor histidine kinase [Candidatus Neomarinimicrobiota bacterium]
MKMSIYKQTNTIKRILLFLAIVMIFSLLWYSQQIVHKLRADLNNQVRFYAGVYARAAIEESDQDFSFIFDEIIRKSSIPMIISAEIDKTPTAWRNVGIEDTDTSPEAVTKLEKIMAEMDSANEPISLKYKNYNLGYIHYGDTKLIRQLITLPYIEISVVALFIFLGYMGFQVIRGGEKRSIWVGMAKETAHQLGTPLTSLLGWIELLRSDLPDNENVDEMARDVQRLENITNRFSRIGSTPAAERISINKIIQEAVDYYNRRLPQLGPGVSIEFQPENDYHVTIIKDLFAWAIENLIKNAIDAVPQKNGKIQIVSGLIKNDKWLSIDVIDNGKGIRSKDKKNIFRPGFSTKKRGWGLGLSLTKRIITEYHHGKLFVVESKPNEKTVMRIMIKAK